jgi:purine-nucleoside phosphorylase
MSAAFGPFREAVLERGPRTAVVLGSGLGSMAGHFRESASVPFHEVPGLCATSVGGHSGRLALGTWGNAAVLVFFGRVHLYEGHSWDAVIAPVRLAADLGAKRIVLTNAAGGIHPDLNPGSLMALRGHLALLDRNAWKSHSVGTPYSERLVKVLQDAGLLAGVYASLTGPSYETPAEIRAYASLGVDAVGMSTAREAEAAAELGLEVAAISCITNRAAGLADGTLDHAEVLTNAKLSVDRLGELIGRLGDLFPHWERRGSCDTAEPHIG